jgi:hypothetical protein
MATAWLPRAGVLATCGLRVYSRAHVQSPKYRGMGFPMRFASGRSWDQDQGTPNLLSPLAARGGDHHRPDSQPSSALARSSGGSKPTSTTSNPLWRSLSA